MVIHRASHWLLGTAMAAALVYFASVATAETVADTKQASWRAVDVADGLFGERAVAEGAQVFRAAAGADVSTAELSAHGAGRGRDHHQL